MLEKSFWQYKPTFLQNCTFWLLFLFLWIEKERCFVSFASTAKNLSFFLRCTSYPSKQETMMLIWTRLTRSLARKILTMSSLMLWMVVSMLLTRRSLAKLLVSYATNLASIRFTTILMMLAFLKARNVYLYITCGKKSLESSLKTEKDKRETLI